MSHRLRSLSFLFPVIHLLLFASVGSSSSKEFFVAKEFHEGGVGGEHGHWIITCGSVGTVIIRARGEAPGLGERAKMVVARLNDALDTWEHADTDEAWRHQGRHHKLTFEIVSTDNGQAIYFVPSHAEEAESREEVHREHQRAAQGEEHGTESDEMGPIKVITVTSGDELGYDRRSAGYVGKAADKYGTDRNPRVTRELIAHWWASVLTDAFSVTVIGEQPVETSGVGRAAVLSTLHERMVELRGSEGNEPALSLSEALDQALDGLTDDQKQSLATVALEVPADFSPHRD